MKNVCLKKKSVELSSKNEFLNTKVKCFELENKKLHDEIISYEESNAFEHESSLNDDLKKKNEMLKKKCNELNDIVLKFTNG